jgi:4-amino-4-deoxy-L-arabinose transferase-like glycosyltransferase
VKSTISRRGLWILLAVFAAGWFCNLGYRHLVKPDEGRYAEIPREMLASGDWLTPRLNGFKYFEKPPLQYWATAAAFSAFGTTEWAARLWPGFTGFLGVLLVFWTGNRLFGPPAGLLGAAVTGSAAIYVAIGHMLTLDMALSFFMSAAVFAFALAQRDAASEGERRRWMLMAWAAAALAVLSKGLIGIALPAGAVALYVLAERDWRLLERLHAFPGALLFLAIAAPWFAAVSAANPEFARFFFIHEHFERFLTREHDRYEPAWYFIPVVLLGILPWIVALFPALARAWKRSPEARFHASRFLLVWCAVVFAFFSASSSKLGSYILPIFPALGLLVGSALASAGPRLLLAQAGVAAGLGVALAVAASQATRFAAADLPPELFTRYAPWLAAAGAALVLAAGASASLALRARPQAAAIALALGGLVSVQTATSGHEELSPAYSAYHIVQKIRNQLQPDVPFYVVNTFDHTLLFYLGRTVAMVVNKDELEQPIAWEPRNYLPDTAAFARAWQADREAFAMFNVNELDGFLKAHPVPMQIVARDARRVIVKKP